MNEIYYVKLHGKANIPDKLSIGHNYKLEADCSITSETRCDNDNGEFDVIYKVEPVTVSIQKDNGKIIKAKDPRRNSQKMRNYLYKIYINEGYVDSFDEVYDTFTNVVMSHTPELLREVIKRLDEKNS